MNHARIAAWLRVGGHVYINPGQIRRYRAQIPQYLEHCWLEIVAVSMPSVEVRRYRANPDHGWGVGIEPVTWSVTAAVLLPRPAKKEANKTGFAMSAVVADHVEKPDIEEIDF